MRGSSSRAVNGFAGDVADCALGAPVLPFAGLTKRRPSRIDPLDAAVASPSLSGAAAADTDSFRADRAMHVTPSNQLPTLLVEPRRRPSLVGPSSDTVAACGSPGASGLPTLGGGGARRLSASSTGASGRGLLLQPISGGMSGAAKGSGPSMTSGDSPVRLPRAGALPGLSGSPASSDYKMADSQ